MQRLGLLEFEAVHGRVLLKNLGGLLHGSVILRLRFLVLRHFLVLGQSLGLGSSLGLLLLGLELGLSLLLGLGLDNLLHVVLGGLVDALGSVEGGHTGILAHSGVGVVGKAS